MSTVGTLSVALPLELIEAIRDAVETGDFASPDEVVQAALQDWQDHRDHGGYVTEELRALIQEGIDSGPPIPGEPVLDRLIKTYEEMATIKGETTP